MQIYCLLNDKQPQSSVHTVYTLDKELFETKNKLGRWVFFAVNDFEATEKQMQEHWVKTARNIKFLKKLRFVFADLDIAKAWDGCSKEEKEKRKKKLVEALKKEMPPTKIIFTSNWIQPLRAIDENNIDDDTINKYTNVINHIISWSVGEWAFGDKVKDVTRILRLPWYYHMKQEPFLVTCESNDLKYKLEDFIGKFWIQDLDPTINHLSSMQSSNATQNKPSKESKEVKKLRQFEEIENLDIKDVIERAFMAVGRNCEYDKQWRLIIDWRLTGNFVGKKWDKEYIASTSHEPFDWNKITAASKILNISTSEAYKWIMEEFNIKTESQLKKEEQKAIAGKELQKTVSESFAHITQREKLLLWYTELISRKPENIIKFWITDFDELLWGIYDWRIYLVWADTWVWKSTFVNYIAQNVASTWQRVVKYSLEDRMEEKAQEEIFYKINRTRYILWKDFYDPINFINWVYNDDPVFQKEALDAINELSNYPIIELKRKKWITPEELFHLINQEADNWTKLFIIDHLHFLDFSTDSESKIDEKLSKTMNRLNEIVISRNISILLVAHYNYQVVKKGKPELNWFRGSSTIKQTVNIAIQIQEDSEGSWRIFYITKIRWLRWKNKETQFYAEYNQSTWEFSFKKTEEQKIKEKHFSAKLFKK